MGYLHDGHGALIQAARERCDIVIVSIFINPTQFAPHEDYNQYPRSIEADRVACQRWGVDVVWTPSESDIYPVGCTRTVYRPPVSLAKPLCGQTRPHFFYGVCNVVQRLFWMVQPTHAFFGDKDLQQRVIIERMVTDLSLPIQIVSCPIVRDDQGIALSSRNAYLTPDQYASLRVIPAILTTICTEPQWREVSMCRRREYATQTLLPHGWGLDYLAIFRPYTGDVIEDGPILKGDHACLAVKGHGHRFIDNKAF